MSILKNIYLVVKAFVTKPIILKVLWIIGAVSIVAGITRKSVDIANGADILGNSILLMIDIIIIYWMIDWYKYLKNKKG